MDRGQWEGLAIMLLTEKGTWRKNLTKNQGFPAPSSTKDKEEKARLTEMKQRMAALLESLQGEDAFREQLALLRELPPHQYTNDEWETLQALVELLRIAAAHLELVFSEQGQVDFPALAQAAIRALGESEAPTDLALALDYRIRHLLMDEFQDTSFNQYELLTRLTAGWQPGMATASLWWAIPCSQYIVFEKRKWDCFSRQENTESVRCRSSSSVSRLISARNKGSSIGSIKTFRTYCLQMITSSVEPFPMHRQQPFTRSCKRMPLLSINHSSIHRKSAMTTLRHVRL